jgi:hypothetical protein
MVCWLQDGLKRCNAEREGEPFTLHDFRRTAITGRQMAGVSEKETSLMVGATPEVIRKHYEKLDAMAIAKRNVERRLAANHQSPTFVAPVVRAARKALDDSSQMSQTCIA